MGEGCPMVPPPSYKITRRDVTHSMVTVVTAYLRAAKRADLTSPRHRKKIFSNYLW